MTKFIEIPASSKSLSMRKPVHGIGINDALYNVTMQINKKQAICPYYKVWKSMIKRCFCDKFKISSATYIDCTVHDEWLTFSNFRKWMETQDWKGKALDKDLIVDGNKHYSPKTCMFVSQSINSLFSDCEASRGEFPLGVSIHKLSGLFRSSCRLSSVNHHLGYSRDITTAEIKYLRFKSRAVMAAISGDEATNYPKLHSALEAKNQKIINKIKKLSNKQCN